MPNTQLTPTEFKLLRTLTDLSLRDVATHQEVGLTTVHRWHSGEHRISPTRTRSLLNLFAAKLSRSPGLLRGGVRTIFDRHGHALAPARKEHAR